MHLKDLEAYWKDWVLKESEGDPFCFLSSKGKEKEKEKRREGEKKTDEQDEDEQDEENKEDEEDEKENIPVARDPTTPPTPSFKIDDDIPLPCQCATPAARTLCLQQLVPEKGDSGKTFHSLVKLIDALEVSAYSNDILLLFLIILEHRYPKWVSEL